MQFVIPVLNYYGHTKATQIYIVLIFTILGTSLLLIWGHRFRVEPLFLALIIGSVFFFQSFTQRLIILLIISCYSFCGIYLHFKGTLLELDFWQFSPYFIFFHILFTATFIFKKYAHLNKINTDLIKNKSEQLAKKNDELKMFAYMAAHDLKTPLRNISIYLGLAKRNTESLESKEEYLNLARENCNDLHNFVNDILEYSRLGHIDIKKQSVNINEVISNIRKQYHFQIEDGKIKIIGDSLPNIVGDPLLLKILFQNIISNGLKYNKSEVATIHITATEEGDYIHIIIKDNGIGIEEKYLKQVFQVFQRLHSSMEYKGTGLGLAISHKIMEDFDGKIHLDSSLEKGTTVTLVFPKN